MFYESLDMQSINDLQRHYKTRPIIAEGTAMMQEMSIARSSMLFSMESGFLYHVRCIYISRLTLFSMYMYDVSKVVLLNANHCNVRK